MLACVPCIAIRARPSARERCFERAVNSSHLPGCRTTPVVDATWYPSVKARNFELSSFRHSGGIPNGRDRALPIAN